MKKWGRIRNKENKMKKNAAETEKEKRIRVKKSGAEMSG